VSDRRVKFAMALNRSPPDAVGCGAWAAGPINGPEGPQWDQ